METKVYRIHRAIGRPVSFKGLKGQYILYAAGALVADLLLFVLLYCCKADPWICVFTAIATGAFSLTVNKFLSQKCGEYGFMKLIARRRAPRSIRITSRSIFIHLKKRNHAHSS